MDDEPTGEAALGDASCGVWTRRASLQVLTEGQVATRVRTGTWQSPWPGVYADAGFELDAVQRAWAAVLASGGEDQPVPFGEPDPQTGRRSRRLRAVAIGRTAARCYGFPLVDDDDPATGGCERLLDEVGVWSHGRDIVVREHGEARVLRRRRVRFRGGDLVQHPSGLWLTSALRTVLDCAVLLPLEAAVCVADAALHEERIEAAELAAVVAARRRHPRAERLRQVVTLADGRAESAGETLTRLLLRPHLPGLEPQVRLWDGGRVVARFDLADERLRLAVEHDGRAGHEGRAADDHRRDRTTRGWGYTTERVTWFDVRRQKEATVARILATASRLEREAAAQLPGQRDGDTPARLDVGAREWR